MPVSLQKQLMDLSEVQFVFNEICKDYPSMEQYLALHPSVVRNKYFESIVNKILNQYECKMNETGRNTVK